MENYIFTINIFIDELRTRNSACEKLRALGVAVEMEKFIRILNSEKCNCFISHPFLYPTFDQIECGEVPCSLFEKELILQIMENPGIPLPQYNPKNLHYHE